MTAERQWVVISYAHAYAPEVIHGPFATVSEAAECAPMRYASTLLPVVNGVRQCTEDNVASELFRRLRRPSNMAQVIDRATQ